MVTLGTVDGRVTDLASAVVLTAAWTGSAPRLWVDGGGTDGFVALDGDGQLDVRLRRGTTHTVRAEQCGDTVDELVLSTRPEAVGDAMVGPTWGLDLHSTDAVWVSPSSRPPDVTLRGFTGSAHHVLVSLGAWVVPDPDTGGPQDTGAVVDPEVSALVAFGESTGDVVWQHSCVTPATVPVDLAGDPDLHIGPGPMVLLEGERRYDFESFELTGRVDATTGRWVDVRLRAMIDLRTLPGAGDSATDPCLAFEAYGASCEPCADQAPDGTELGCLPLELIWPVADPVPALVLDPAVLPEPGC